MARHGISKALSHTVVACIILCSGNAAWGWGGPAMKAIFTVPDQNGKSRVLELTGRNAWALSKLVEAGKSGCTPITTPGPRWSGYVHNLRHEYGLDIQTVYETHRGPFPGSHARYVLHSSVSVVSIEFEAA